MRDECVRVGPLIEAVAVLPDDFDPDLRLKLKVATANGAFHFPAGCSETELIKRVLVQRETLIRDRCGLRDPLAVYLPHETSSSEALTDLCVSEIAAAKRLSGRTGDLDWSMKAGLIAARRSYGFVDCEPRRTTAQTFTLEGGVSLRYPPPERATELLARVERSLGALQQDEVGFAAAITYAGSIHIHLFRDGNKRTARLLWSGIMASVGGTPLPLALLSNIDRRSFQLCVRRVVMFGQWTPFLSYILEAAWAIQSCDRPHPSAPWRPNREVRVSSTAG